MFLLYRGNNVFDDTRMISFAEYKMRNKQITRTCRKIERVMNRHRLQLRKEAEGAADLQSCCSSSNSNKDQEEEKEAEKKSRELDVDLEEMLENSLENSE